MTVSEIVRKLISLAVLALVVAALASGCGGSDAGDAASRDEPPAAEPPAQGARVPGGGLTVEEAIVSDLDTVLLVRGSLVMEGDGSPRLCGALAESFPPQCGGASLIVEGLDLGTIENLESEGDVVWAERVELLGTVEDGVLTLSRTSSAGGTATEDIPAEPPQERAELVAAAVARLVTEDNSFGGEDVFDRVDVAEVIGGDPARPLQPRTLELIAASLEASVRVVFVRDANAAIDGYLDEMVQGTAVVSVEDVRVQGESAEVELRLWCGSLCGVFLTYEAKLTEVGWEILGPLGPIAVS